MKKYYPLLILLNVVWALSALVYDWQAMRQIPVLLWPFIVICPIYPALLAIVWNRERIKKPQNSFLLAFAVFPSIIYLLASLLYYPAWMATNGFDWAAFGQIFWVLFYGAQAIYLYNKIKMPLLPRLSVAVFLATSFVVQYRSNTYGYLDFISINRSFLLMGYAAMAAVLLLLVLRQTQYAVSKNHQM